MQYGRKMKCPVCGFRRPIEGDVCPTCHSVSIFKPVQLSRTQQVWLFVAASLLLAGAIGVCISDKYFGTNLFDSLKAFCTQNNRP